MRLSGSSIEGATLSASRQIRAPLHACRHEVPLQLAAQKIKVVVARRMKHRHGHLGRPDLEHVSGLHVAEFLHVAIGDGIARIGELNVDRHADGKHDGTIG